MLLLSMYQLDGELRGPPVRVSQVRDALGRHVRLDVIAGDRWRRAVGLAHYVARRRVAGLGGIYVESSTALVGPADIAFLWLARSRHVPVLSYVRDAYQLFPEYYPLDSLKRRLSRFLFPLSLRALDRVSDWLAFPSRGLATVVLRDTGRAASAPLLPPGARLTDAPPVDPAARALLYVGSLAHRPQGGDLLLEAVGLVRERGLDLELICVTPPGDEPPGPRPAWLRVVRADATGVDALLPEVLASVTPRRRSTYNDLSIPIKVLEYLGYGRPLLVTDATETAAIVHQAGCGLVVPDSAEGLAEGIATIASADPRQIRGWGGAARRAAEANSWDARAQQILELLGLPA
jgi:glycosyltransferase involved in cell wall biosynthesis